MKPKSAVVIVEGAGLQRVHYEPLIDALSTAGFTVRCSHLPTNGDPNRPPKATQEDNIAVVQADMRELKDASYRILLIMHSAGGSVGSDAAIPELYAQNSDEGGIIALIYICTHIVQPGNTIMQTLTAIRQVTAKTHETHAFSDDGIVTVLDPLNYFFAELEDRSQAKALADAVTTSNAAIAVTPVTRAPWKDLPTTYVFTEKDEVLLPHEQRAMIEQAKENGAEDWQIIELNTGHFPTLTETRSIVDLAESIMSKDLEI